MNWQEIGVIVAIIGVINTITLWALQLMLKRQASDFDSKLSAFITKDTEHDTDIETLRRDLEQHKLDTARNYLHRDDAVIFSARFEQKLDAIWKFLHEHWASLRERTDNAR